jgi:hypothetical protein
MNGSAGFCCIFSALLLAPLAAVRSAEIAELRTLPLLAVEDFEYLGGFRFPAGDRGVSNMTYAEGPIAVGAGGQTLFAVGHAHQQAVAEFEIPPLVNSLSVRDLNIARGVQNFASVLARPSSGNPQGIDRIGGMQLVDGRLVINGYVYYDAAGAATHTTLVVEDARDLAASAIGGYFSYSAAAHAAGWMAPIPPDWQTALGGTHVTGNSSGKPIISRLSVGPSAFAFSPGELDENASPRIRLVRLMDFSLDHVLGIGSESVKSYLFNHTRTNTLWNHLSWVATGFVVPGTRTYATIGTTGGLASGVGYKIVRDDGYECPGYCAYEADDNYNYYWLWDVNDFLDVRAGRKRSYSLMPYDHGRFQVPYAQDGFNAVIGGTFDEMHEILYLSLRNAERVDGGGWVPVIVAFGIRDQ